MVLSTLDDVFVLVRVPFRPLSPGSDACLGVAVTVDCDHHYLAHLAYPDPLHLYHCRSFLRLLRSYHAALASAQYLQSPSENVVQANWTWHASYVKADLRFGRCFVDVS